MICGTLRSAWRANLWNNFQRSNNRGRALSGFSWYDVAPSFDSLRKILDTFPPQEKTQVFAVVVGHVVSPAAFEGRSLETHCPFCKQNIVPTFDHVTWFCPAWSDRPVRPSSELQAQLGWPPYGQAKEESKRILHHMGRVRSAICSWRHDWGHRRRAASATNRCSSTTRQSIDTWNLFVLYFGAKQPSKTRSFSNQNRGQLGSTYMYLIQPKYWYPSIPEAVWLTNLIHQKQIRGRKTWLIG